jgi:hypothetical protein
MAFNYSPKIINDSGLVLYLDAANPKSYVSGSTLWTDVSRGGNNGTLTNGPIYSSTNNGGIVFDGTNTFIQGNTIVQPIGQITVSAWYKATGAPSTNDSFGGVLICSSPQLSLGYTLSHSWTNQLVTFSTVVNEALITGNNTALNNQVNHIVGVWNGTQRFLYINGVLSTSGAYSTAIGYPSSGDRNFRIGMWGFSTFGRNFKGNIYNTQIYNRALTAAEVLKNYNALKGRFV